jgi:hypothetical protein
VCLWAFVVAGGEEKRLAAVDTDERGLRTGCNGVLGSGEFGIV